MFSDLRSRLLLALLTSGLSACTCGGTPTNDPTVTAVAPGWTFDTESVSITIEGTSFTPRASLHFGAAGDDVTTDATFHAFVGERELTDVVWVDAQHLTAVVPSGLAVGSYAVRVVDPYGTEASLADGFEVRTRQGAKLIAALSTNVNAVRVGTSIAVWLDVTNAGDTEAREVLPIADGSSGSARVTQLGVTSDASPLAPGAMRRFEFTWGTSGIGEVTFAAHATAVDSFSANAMSSPVVSAGPVTVNSPPIIDGVATVARATVSVGQPIVLELVASNRGQTAVNALQPVAVASPGALVDPKSVPTSRDIAAGASHQFEFTFDTLSRGDVSFTVDASGIDAQTLMPLSMQPATATVHIVDAAALVVTGSAPMHVSRGQRVTVSQTVRNAGEAKALLVTPSLAVSGSGQLTAVSAPAVIAEVGASQVDVQWQFDATGVGTVQLTLGASGNDENSGAVVAAAQLVISVVIDAPASLDAGLIVAPTVVNVGQSFEVQLGVTNEGEAAALNVTPGALIKTGDGGVLASSGVAPASRASLAAGLSQVFTYDHTATSVGTVTFSALATGSDSQSMAAITSNLATASVLIQRPAALSLAYSVPIRVNVGQVFPWSLTVTNSGDSTANAVSPAAIQTVGTTSATRDAGPTPATATVPGNSASATFGFLFVAGDAGTLAFRTTASGTDAVNPISVVTSPVSTSATITVETPAALTGSLSIPSTLAPSQAFTATMTINNTGQAVANAVTPSALTLVGNATLVSGPTPASASIPGGTSATFTFSYTAGSTGTVQLSGSASGVDSNTGAPVATALLSSNTATITGGLVPLAVDPFGDGTSFSNIFSYSGRVWLGPRKTGTGAVSMNPDGSSPTNHSFSFLRDSVGPNTHDNTSSSPYPSIGSLGCTLNTASCGPNNENGRGLFASGTLGGIEWLTVAGAHPSAGKQEYVYLSFDTGSTLSFRYIDISAGLGGQTKGVSSTYFFNNRLYFGFPDSGGNRPYLLALLVPPGSPGLNAQVSTSTAGGTDVLDLQGDRLPDLGQNGGNQAGTELIDSMVALNDRLYLANNGGIIRTTTNQPRGPGVAPSDWSLTTPTAAAFTTRTSQTTPKVAELLPSDRAFPALVPYQGKLYAARNTTTGPQLWACTPGSDQLCAPSEWALIAANSTGDTQLTQFNAPGNTTIGLLGATQGGLFIGFNNAAGVQLFKSTVAAPTSRADFTGVGGCVAGNSGCEGIGGNGLGAPTINTQIFDSAALRFSSVDWVYLVTGNGSVGVRVWRISG